MITASLCVVIDTTAGLVIGLLIFLLRFAENMMDTVYEVSVKFF